MHMVRPRPVVLAVLDDSERSALLKLSLEGRGWEVVRAHSCEQARSRALEQPPDAVLTDLVLPDGSAFGLLRSFDVRPRVVVVLTWGNQHGIRERIASSGFSAHLIRPISGEDIDGALRQALKDAGQDATGSAFSDLGQRAVDQRGASRTDTRARLQPVNRGR
jgi:DNA-binding response OmpR family regulator